MHTRSIQKLSISLCALALVIVFVFLDKPRTIQGNEPTLIDTNHINDLGDSRWWVKITEQPYLISSTLDLMCRAATAPDYSAIRKQNPHLSAYVHVYANTKAAPAMQALGRIPFPVGSILVKQKFYAENVDGVALSKPDLYTVMIKREAGFNPETGDWEFAVISGDRQKVLAQGKLENCMSCHKGADQTGYVFGSYAKERRLIKS